MNDFYRKGAEIAAQDFPHNRLASRVLRQVTMRFGLRLPTLTSALGASILAMAS